MFIHIQTNLNTQFFYLPTDYSEWSDSLFLSLFLSSLCCFLSLSFREHICRIKAVLKLQPEMSECVSERLFCLSLSSFALQTNI